MAITGAMALATARIVTRQGGTVRLAAIAVFVGLALCAAHLYRHLVHGSDPNAPASPAAEA